MKILTYLSAVFFINLVKGHVPDPTKHKNWGLVNTHDCGRQPARSRQQISFVRTAKIGEYPWAVLILIQNPEVNGVITLSECMGTIITNRHILTASSCFQKFGNNEIPELSVYARVGELDRSEDPDCYNGVDCAPKFFEYAITKVTYYRSNDRPESGKNIALLITARTMRFNDYVSPICLEYGELLDTDYAGQLGIALTGWGQNNSYGVLKHARVLIMTAEECTGILQQLPGAFRSRQEDQDTAFCAGEVAGEPQLAVDIGGPFMVERAVGRDKPRIYLYGILSLKAHPNREPLFSLPQYGTPDVYTKVRHYLQWILEHIDFAYLPLRGPLTGYY